ncbi:phospholipase B1, membrane-associated isoform X3 [Solenopsis invicta]|uniref:phospholipase B1, membrane-associated isoform X3 n=1 Tax=Solenopsis invicta TaxID=13686 RepID=UPI00193E4E94|nr:phospholipase B1, membrane-associated isoform X3 [Solenopsis invicta]
MRTMWKWWQLYYILQIFVLATGRKFALGTPFNTMLFRALREWSFDAFGWTGTEEKYLQIARKANKMQKIVPDDVPFPCNVTSGRSPKVPTSVHKLRPGDIDVIAAMGDSLTAGAGIFANNVFQIAVENRGVTAAGGGQGTWREYLTLPNILKFVSLMIGSNDFCSKICWVSSPWSTLETHKTDLLKVLRTLRDNLPRTFVALILPPHLKALVDTRKGRSTFTCFVTTDIECSCLFGSSFRRFKPLYYNIMSQWQKLDMEIATYPEFQRDDFAVVSEPILANVTIPLASDGYADMTYLSSDCFHVTQKTNALYANGLWNNLFEPVSAKTMTWETLFHKFHCPTPERPYLTTMLNSQCSY